MSQPPIVVNFSTGSFTNEKRSVTTFAAGPSRLPYKVLRQAQEELVDYDGLGVSVMEMSHRSAEFASILNQCEQSVRELLSLPKNYVVLFMQGGGTMQFANVAMNLMNRSSSKTADYIVTGTWSAKAAKEAKKYGKINEIPATKNGDLLAVPNKDNLNLSPDASYVYYCYNETVHGVEFPYIPEPPNDIPLVCDMSSNILSRPIDVEKFGVIFAGAQKNIGCAGVTLVIVREDLLNHALPITPSMCEYKVQAANKSMLNTPPTFSIYMMGLVLRWIKNKGGLDEMERRNVGKAKSLYSYIESTNGYYKLLVDKPSRSRMNIVFRLKDSDEQLESCFVKEAKRCSFTDIKGHRSIGGIRISCYNAIKPRDILNLINFMEEFRLSYP